MIVTLLAFGINHLFSQTEKDSSEYKIKANEILVDCYALPEVSFEGGPDIETEFVYAEMVLPDTPLELLTDQGKIAIEKRLNFELKKGHEIIPTNFMILQKKKINAYTNSYILRIPIKGLLEGDYCFNIKVNLPGGKKIVFPSAKKEHFTIKKAITDEDKYRSILAFAGANYISLQKREKMIYDAFTNKKVKPLEGKLSCMRALFEICYEQQKFTESAAWLLCEYRFWKKKDIFIMGGILETNIGWDKINKHKDEIENKALDFKKKYFPEIKYQFSPKELNLTTIFNDFNELNQKIKKDRKQAKEEREKARKKEKLQDIKNRIEVMQRNILKLEEEYKTLNN